MTSDLNDFSYLNKNVNTKTLRIEVYNYFSVSLAFLYFLKAIFYLFETALYLLMGFIYTFTFIDIFNYY